MQCWSQFCQVYNFVLEYTLSVPCVHAATVILLVGLLHALFHFGILVGIATATLPGHVWCFMAL